MFLEGKRPKAKKKLTRCLKHFNRMLEPSFHQFKILENTTQNMDKVKAMGLGHADTPKSPRSKYAQCNLRSQRRDTDYQQIEPNL